MVFVGFFFGGGSCKAQIWATAYIIMLCLGPVVTCLLRAKQKIVPCQFHKKSETELNNFVSVTLCTW